MVIGAKHGPVDLPIDGAAFHLMRPNFATTVASFNDHWTFVGIGSGNDKLCASVRLPVGTTIHTIKWHFNKSSQAAGITLTVRKRNETGGVYTNSDVDAYTDVSSGASYTSITRSVAYEVAPGDMLYLAVQVGNAAHQFSHAVLRIERR